MGRVDVEQRLIERRVWLVAGLAAAGLFAILFHAFPSLPDPMPRRRPPAPAVIFQPWQPLADSAAHQAVLSPVLIALPLRAVPAHHGRPGETQSDRKPSLEVPSAGLLRSQPPREIGPSLDEWVARLRRDRTRPPEVQTRPPGPAPMPNEHGPLWRVSGGLAGLEADLVPVFQLGEEASLSGVFTAWLELDASGRVARVLVEPAVSDRVLAAKLDRAFRECLFWPAGEPREGRLVIRIP